MRECANLEKVLVDVPLWEIIVNFTEEYDFSYSLWKMRVLLMSVTFGALEQI